MRGRQSLNDRLGGQTTDAAADSHADLVLLIPGDRARIFAVEAFPALGIREMLP